jgi:hypothetical protein
MKLTKELAERQLMTMKRPGGGYAIRDLVAVTAFKGKEGIDYPEVPISDQVNLERLTEGDTKPFFVTMRIAQAGVESGNGIWYGDEEANEILRQTVQKRPTGGQGHLRADEVGSALPANPLHWVGALRQNEFDWGKAYVAPGETRDWMRRLGATNSELATSIFAYAEQLRWDEEHEALRIVLHPVDEQGKTGFELEYIDLASPERAGVPSLAVVPKITSEMVQEESMTDKLDIIKALTADDAKLLPETVRQALIAQSDENKALAELQRQIAALRTALGLDDKTNLVEFVQAMATAAQQNAAATVKAKIEELINDPKAGVKIASLRGLVLELVQAKAPKTVQEAETTYKAVMESDAVKSALADKLIETMGQPQRRPVNAPAGETTDNEFVIIPAKA